MTQTKTAPQVGDVRTWDYQSDTFGGQYRLVEDLGKGLWRAERLAPTEAEIDAILEYAASVEGTGWWMSTIEDVERELELREELAGTEFKIRLVSSAAYSEMF